MKILLLSAQFPPEAKGGAEATAYQTARWLSGNGMEVGVLTAARSRDAQVFGDEVDGFKTWRLWYPRPYAPHDSDRQSPFKKVLWHLQDHYDPRNTNLLQGVLHQFQPDMLHVHLLSGIGHNCLKAANSARIPVIYFLHDSGLACLLSSMFSKGKNCTQLCRECRVSSSRKLSYLTDSSLYTLVSPSSENLANLQSLANISHLEARVIPNIDLSEPPAKRVSGTVEAIRLLYVGRLHKTKGIQFLLNVLSTIDAPECNWQLTVLGSGPLETELRNDFADDPRIAFLGKVSQQSVQQYMAQSDVLLVPSLWRENHPGVVREALRAGVPAVISNMGGMPEMIVNEYSGLILETGNEEAWRQALVRLTKNKQLVARLQAGASEAGNSYSADRLGAQLLDTMNASFVKAKSPVRAELQVASPTC